MVMAVHSLAYLSTLRMCPVCDLDFGNQGMLNASAVGLPMLAPTTSADVAADKAVLSPAAWHGGPRTQFLRSLAPWWQSAEDVNDSDLDLVELTNTDARLGPVGQPMVVMFYCWGSQHSSNGLGLATAPGTLADFLAAFF
eukprot:SAG22_NODE_56_length_23716_cov_11.146759_11_plen_140_part_00